MKQLLAALLSGLMVVSVSNPVYAEEVNPSDAEDTVLESYDLNPETLHVKKLGETDEEEIAEADALPYKLNDIVRVSIVLDEESTLDAGYSVKNYAENQAAKDYRSQLKARQNIVAGEIEAVTGEALDVQWNLTLAVNIISANVKYGDIEKIRNVNGVADVFLENRYEAQEDEINTANTSEGMVGAAETWNLGYTGAGMKVAIIDTGIDTSHQSFDGDAYSYAISQLDKSVEVLDKSKAEALIKATDLNASGAVYFNAKIPYGYNYVDKNTTITHLNDTEGEHGSHVAGIAAANRYIKSGNSYVDAAETVKAVGMAPDAQLFVMKVFGAKGGAYDSDYFAAIEDALALGCDSVNLSLGSGMPGFSYAESYQAVMNKLTASDDVNLVATISAGNSGALTDNMQTDLYIDDIYMHTGGNPGTFINSLGVAAAQNTGDTGTPLKFNDSQTVYYTETESTGALLKTIKGSYSYVYIDSVGEAADYKAVDSAVSLSGKIVIVNRGSLSFSEKGNNAKSYSPKALLIANNGKGTISMDLSDYTGTFPMASITLADAEMIKANSTKGTAGDYTYYTGTVQVTDTLTSEISVKREDAEVTDFSSWGVPGSLLMKPEVTAPGGNIYSVWGTNKTKTGTAGGSDQYELMSGTSMAAPHMAGLSAVLQQYLKENKISVDGYSLRAINQSLLMSTATPMINNGEYVSVLQQGAGLVDVSKAVSASSVIFMDETDGSLTARTGAAKDGKVKAEIGDNPSRKEDYTYSFTIHNLNNVPVEYALDTKLFTQDSYEEDGDIFMSPTTTAIDGWTVSYAWADGNEETHDANKDGKTNKNDVQAILDYAIAQAAEILYEEPFDTKEADLNGDGTVNTADAYELIEWLKGGHSKAAGTVPANGSRKVTVTITPDDSLDGEYPAGAYVEGYTYINAVTETKDGAAIDVEHTIPVIGFYGSWTDPSMFDNTSYVDTVYGTERIPYSGNTNTNYMTVQYNGVSTKFTGNPYKAEDKFPVDHLALNSNSQIDNVYYNLIRSAGTTGFALSRIDDYGGDVTEVLSSTVSGNAVTGLWYYTNQGTWQNTGTKFYSFRKTPASFGLKEGDMFRAGFYAVPEYNGMLVSKDMTDASAGALGTASFKNVLLSNVLGEGAYIGYDFRIDNTAPEISEASLSGNTISVSASDNEALAYVAVLSLDGSVSYAEAVPGTDKYTITFDGSDAIANAHGYVAVFAGDYAGNETAKAVKVNDNMYEEKTVYVQTNTLTPGNDYLIVNRNTSGSGYALGRYGSTTVSTSPVTVKNGNSDTNNAVYIESSDAAETSIWTVGSGYTFKNGSYYIRYSNRRLSISSSSTNWTWDGNNSRLSYGSSYLAYSGNSYTVTSSASSVYMYVKTVIRSEVDPYGVSSVTVTPDSLDIYKGSETDLVAKVLPLTADDRTVTWTSSNTAVASVDEHGHVTANGAGSATITAAANGNSTKTATVDVAVTSVNKTLNGIVWDENGGVYFSSFNASSLPSYTKLHSEGVGKELNSAFMYSSSQLYAATLDTSSASTEIYSVNRNNYSLTDYGTNYVWAADMAPGVSGSSYSQYAGLVYAFSTFLVAGPLEPQDDGEGGTYCGLPYGATNFSESTGGAYFAGIACETRSNGEAAYFVLDENGVIWHATMLIGSSIYFDNLTKVVDTGIGTSFLYQNLYYDGTYIYWAHTDNSETELIIINPDTGAVYHAGNFGQDVWPVTGMYVNGSVAPSDIDDEVMDAAEPLNLSPVITRSELMSEEVMNRFNAEAAKFTGAQSYGSTNSIKNYKPADRTVRRNTAVLNNTKAPEEDTANGVSVTLSEEKETHNGLYKVTYDPAKISYVSNSSNSEFSAEYIDTEKGIVYIAYADGEGFKADETIDTVTFTEPEVTTTVTVATVERGNEQVADEPEEIEVGGNTSVIEGIEFRHSCSFGNNLAINYYVPKDALEGYENIHLEVRKEVYDTDGNVTWETTELKDYSESTTDGVSYYKFVYAGIAAKEMGSEVCMIVKAEKNGETYVSEEDVYGVSTYAYSRLEKSTDTVFKTLLVDMLNYGAAAQNYFGYRTDVPVNAALTAEQKALGTQKDPVLSSVENTVTTPGATAVFHGKSVVFNANTELKYYMQFAENQNLDDVKLVLTYTAIDGRKYEETIPASTFGYDNDEKAYTAKLVSIAAKDIGCTISAKIYDGNLLISDIIDYSIETYAYNRLQKSDDEVFKVLLRELMKYGFSAKAYFEK